ncbi:hypothetical protein PoB_004230700 [Plakobranchus ocellatus]|uniref:Uncharacterized protein n=1 Tax=Plakobranchus ocellatus TaxID=259542 RepID=A0AAV4B8K2_9GAST|nr:hypothetical protein PoB_004230700 [Plakobranchus ocellatus]
MGGEEKEGARMKGDRENCATCLCVDTSNEDFNREQLSFTSEVRASSSTPVRLLGLSCGENGVSSKSLPPEAGQANWQRCEREAHEIGHIAVKLWMVEVSISND